MQEDIKHIIEKLLHTELAPLQAKIDFLEDELAHLQERTAELERQLTDIELNVDVSDAAEGINDPPEMNAINDAMLDHLVSLQNDQPRKNISHVSLTIDLSKKKL